MPDQPERAGAAQGDRGALDGRDGDGDRLVQHVVQHVVGVAMHVRAECEAELEPHVGFLGGAGRWLGERAAQVRRCALRSAARAGPPCRLAQRRDGGRGARGLGAQQVQPDALRVGALAREQRGGVRMPQRPLAGAAGSCTAFPRSADARASARARPRAALRRAARRRRGPRRRRRAGRAPAAWRNVDAGPEDGDRARERARALGQPRELALDDAPDLLGPERPEPRGGLVVRC